MSVTAEEIVILQIDNMSAWTEDTNLFLGPIRPVSDYVPQTSTFVMITGGNEPINFSPSGFLLQESMFRVQVTVRGAAEQYGATRAAADLIYRELHDRPQSDWFMQRADHPTPIYTGQDDKGAHIFTINFTLGLLGDPYALDVPSLTPSGLLNHIPYFDTSTSIAASAGLIWQESEEIFTVSGDANISGDVDIYGDLTVSGTIAGVDLPGHVADTTIHFTEASIDHGSISGLDGDDHPHYLTETRHDALAADNPHSVTFTQAVSADGSTDISAGEAETLTDGSEASSLHTHGSLYYTETEVDSRFSASGVTNGNSHDHSGGDGAQINHTSLSNVGSNTHPQIDTHIANISNPHSVTFTQAVSADGNTDISAAEAETLTDGSNADALHTHSGVAPGPHTHAHSELTGVGTDDHLGYTTLTGNATRNAITGTFSFSGGSLVLPNGTSTPASGVEGQVFWDNDDDTLYVWDGSAWTDITASGVGGGTSDHGSLTGLDDNDHGAIYYTQAQINAIASGINHGDLQNVGTDDHHSESHVISSHSDTTATGAELETLTDGSDASSLHIHDNRYYTETEVDARFTASGVSNGNSHDHSGGDGAQISHATLSNITANDHHNEAHNIASHSDTSATGVQLDILVGGGSTTLHTHSHTNLGDIGTYTHSELDQHVVSGQTHIADTSIHFAEGSIDHANLINLNSASYTHLTAANHTDLTDGNATTLHKHSHTNLDDIGSYSHSELDQHTVSGQIHIASASNPHSVTFTQVVAADGGTDISAAEAEELTDGSDTTLHIHDSRYYTESEVNTLLSGVNHGDLENIGADDHHPQLHTIASHSDTSATGAELNELTDGSTTTLHTHTGLGGDHGVLTGLSNDDHIQYYNETRGDARYYTQSGLDSGDLDGRYYTESEVNTLLSGVNHADLENIGVNDHHNELHTIASHNDTSATGAELNELTDGSTTSLHSHAGIDNDHGTLSGLLDDDHTNYILVDGTRGFTGVVSGIEPVADNDLATKKYVDDNGGGGVGTTGSPVAAQVCFFSAADTITGDAELTWSAADVLQFGGSTSSFSGFKRNNSRIYCRLADDSGYGYFGAGEIRVFGSVYCFDDRMIYLGGGQDAQIRWRNAITNPCVMFSVDNTAKNIIFTANANVTSDHDHGNSSNPTLFVHSNTDPDSANDEWISLSHDVTNGVIDVGSGAVEINANFCTGTSSPDASAAVDITSTTQGFLPPRMTSTEKTNISSPAAGLIVFDTTVSGLCFYDGAAWKTVTAT